MLVGFSPIHIRVRPRCAPASSPRLTNLIKSPRGAGARDTWNPPNGMRPRIPRDILGHERDICARPSTCRSVVPSEARTREHLTHEGPMGCGAGEAMRCEHASPVWGAHVSVPQAIPGRGGARRVASRACRFGRNRRSEAPLEPNPVRSFVPHFAL